MKLDGFVIVPPINSWENKDKVWLWMGYSSFGLTAAQAWMKRIGCEWNDPDRSIKIQKWHDRGYRVKKATMEIHDD